MFDRAQQALHLLALDPVVETTADKNSYGFRQQRSCADAIGQCFITLSHAPNTQWILEADVKNCFDKISHAWLLAHVPMDRAILQKRLKSEASHRRLDGNTMTVVLADLWENERRVSSPVKSLCRAIYQAHKPSETKLWECYRKKEPIKLKLVVFLREPKQGADQPSVARCTFVVDI